MINFHKYGYFDIKKLSNFLSNKSIKLTAYNPYWLFLWSDVFHPEIAFKNDICYIRVSIPDVGISYYPPIGEDVSYLDAIKEIEDDARESGIDFNIGPVDDTLYYKILGQKINLIEYKKYESYTYLNDDIAFMKPSKVKKAKKKYDSFNRSHKNSYFKRMEKEDFNSILEFINTWNMETNNGLDSEYYQILNMLKLSMEHMYELDLIGIILMDDTTIYGYAIGGLFGNTAYIYQLISLDTDGIKETLVSSFAKTCGIASRYLELDYNHGDSIDDKLKESLNPISVEKYYATYGK